MTDYPWKTGIDYGVRQGTLGLDFHMAEGGDGTVDYLARRQGETDAAWRTRVRGVSANAVCKSDGTIYNMVAWDHAAGALNPADRSTWDKGYYGAKYLQAVLGSHWPDPNTWSIAIEICGYRAIGPTDAQVRACVAWGADMRHRFPTLRGAFGHADQTDTKGCPGTTPNMKAIFAGVGGHGLWDTGGGILIPAGDDVRYIQARGYNVETGMRLPVAAGSSWRTFDGTATGTFGDAKDVPVLGLVDGHSDNYAVLINTGDTDIYADGTTRATIVLVQSSAALKPVPAPTVATVDCSAIQAELDAANGNLAACQADLINIKAAGFEAGRAKGIELLEGMTL
jgi:hypothetical protein